MPNIRQYDNKQTIDPQPLEQAAYRMERTGIITGNAIREGGEALSRGVQKIGEHEDIQQTSDLMAQGASLQRVFADDLNTTLKNADPSKIDEVSDKWQQSFENKMGDFGSDASGPKAREAALRIRSSLLDTFTKERIAQTSNIAGLAVESNLNKSANDYAKTVFDNPSMAGSTIDLARGSFKTMLDAHKDLSADTSAKLNEEFNNTTIPGIANAGLEGVTQRVEAGTMKPEDALKAIGPGTVLHDKASNEKYNEVSTRITKAQQTYASIQSSVDAASRDDMIKAARQGDPQAQTWLENQSKTAIGATPKDTIDMRAKYAVDARDTSQFAAATADVQKMNKPQLQATKDALPAEGARLPSDEARAAAGAKIADYNANPSLFMIANDRVVHARYMDFAKKPTPEAFQAYAQAQTVTQTTFDPSSKVPPDIIPPSMKDDITQRMQAANLDTSNGAMQAATTLADLKKFTGPYWMATVHELQRDGTLRPGQYVAGVMMDNPASAALANDVLQATTMSDTQLNKVSNLSSAQADTMARTALQNLADTFKGESPEQLEAYATSLAAVLRYRSVGSTTLTQDDATPIEHDMIGHNYTYAGGMRIPDKLDADSVTAGTDSVMGDIGSHKIVVPPSGSGLGAIAQRDQYVSDIQKYGSWTTSEDGKSARLLGPLGRPVYEHDKYGNAIPVEVPFDTLEKVGKSNADASQDYSGPNPPASGL